MVLAPWVVHSIYSYMVKDEKERDLGNLLIFPFLMSRMLHNQIWISLSRYRTAKGTNRIVDKTIDFEQWSSSTTGSTELFTIIIFTLAITPTTIPPLPLSPFHVTATSSSSPRDSSPSSLPSNISSILLRFTLCTILNFEPITHSSCPSTITSMILWTSLQTPYETSLRQLEEAPDAVHLTHLITPESIYHLWLGFASLASRPQASKWYLWVMWPVTFWSMMVTQIYGRTFVVERNIFGNLKLQTWAIPKYNIQYLMQWQRESINGLIEDAIMEAEGRGIRVLSLGLMNQGEELNKNGELYIRRNPQLKVKVVDGSSLAVAVVLNSIPKGTTQVLLRGILSKVSYSIALALCQRGIQVSTLYEDEYNKLKLMLGTEASTNLVLAKTYAVKTWLVGEGLREGEQMRILCKKLC
ncbi:hypothetical protein ACSBR2_017094 [Camellia fascicularis]